MIGGIILFRYSCGTMCVTILFRYSCVTIDVMFKFVISRAW